MSSIEHLPADDGLLIEQQRRLAPSSLSSLRPQKVQNTIADTPVVKTP